MPVEYAWLPTVKQVASRLLARTMDENGNVMGTFTSETKPTGEQVNEAIAQVVALMAPRLGEVPDKLVPQAQALASLRTAYVVELGFFPEQTELNISPARALQAEYKEELENFDIAATGLQPNSPSANTSIKMSADYPGYSTPFDGAQSWF